MNILINEHKELLIAMLHHKVSFILIGGYAVNYYGYDRMTGDMDIWLKPTNDNRANFLKAISDFGIVDEDVVALSKKDFTTPQMFFFGAPPRRIDFLLLSKLSGVSYDEATEEANHFNLETQQVPIIHYHHLLLTKMNTGRKKDEADIEELQRINKYRNDKNT